MGNANFLQKIRAFFKKRSAAEPASFGPVKEITEFNPQYLATTSILTEHQATSVNATLEIALKSIFSAAQFECLLPELFYHLKATDQDHDYQIIHKGSIEFINAQLKQAHLSASTKRMYLNALDALFDNAKQTRASQSAYKLDTKSNYQAVFYPNPQYGKPLWSELPYVEQFRIVTEQTQILTIGDKATQFLQNSINRNPHCAYYCLPEFSLDKCVQALQALASQPFHQAILTADLIYLQFASTAAESLAQAIHQLQTVLNIIQALNPHARVIFALSPLPIRTIATSTEHTIVASSLMKAMLRVAMEKVVEQYPEQSFYFSAFDTVMYSVQEPFQEDALSATANEKLEQLFKKMFCSHQLQKDQVNV